MGLNERAIYEKYQRQDHGDNEPAEDEQTSHPLLDDLAELRASVDAVGELVKCIKPNRELTEKINELIEATNTTTENLRKLTEAIKNMKGL
jgi:hypothetical protein